MACKSAAKLLHLTPAQNLIPLMRISSFLLNNGAITMQNAKYLKVEAGVRYWDDARVNGDNSESGENVPFKVGDLWCPIIDIKTGKIIDWPQGVVANFHFKVCDAGTYHLLNDAMEVIASRENNYVPDGLCHGDQGYGDYIIFSVDADGQIRKYRNSIDFEDFEPA